MNKKTFYLKDYFSQSGGSVLQAMQKLLGLTAQEGSTTS